VNRFPVLVGAAVTMLVLLLAGYRTFGVAVGCLGIFLAFKVGPRPVGLDRAFSVEQRRALLERDGMFCVYPHCRRPVHYASDCPFGGCDDDYEADHVEAWSTGGATTLDNAVVACRRCNRLKGARLVEEFVEDPDGDGVPGIG
jgi:hypothetical protein